jgi:catechol 2,3-dioxygenase-like lactoylglutathione lyase family enzyme
MAVMVEKISAVTCRVRNMRPSVQFYREVLCMETLYGGEGSAFSSLRPKNADSAILNLEHGETMTRWGALK